MALPGQSLQEKITDVIEESGPILTPPNLAEKVVEVVEQHYAHLPLQKYLAKAMALALGLVWSSLDSGAQHAYMYQADALLNDPTLTIAWQDPEGA